MLSIPSTFKIISPIGIPSHSREYSRVSSFIKESRGALSSMGFSFFLEKSWADKIVAEARMMTRVAIIFFITYSISRLISIDFIEWVSPPTEIISIPAEATFFMFLRLIPPEASKSV